MLFFYFQITINIYSGFRCIVFFTLQYRHEGKMSIDLIMCLTAESADQVRINTLIAGSGKCDFECDGRAALAAEEEKSRILLLSQMMITAVLR